ncbi:MAG: phosphoribosylformylglycinamidine synthase subunit PurS [Actinomycetota bacterium]|nr:phosphoribosylformylglycinamidine synthase subunit PurS [Actinomycetota bacterium]MDH5224823.1 phosphoribosylformylglycinamidine synthase subunit PurS [Actinomycetota bacterium]MDH5313188.1 phosphoribosylformylglycinamidine synthase subunit PurS [Actinomycetota bacterium]
MTFTFEVLVTLKPGLADPQGKAVEASLPAMGFANVSGVHVGRHVRLDVEATNEATAAAQVEEVARRLLSNPVIEDFRVLQSATADGAA